MNFRTLIENIEKRPKAYLINESILELSNLLLGFSLSDHEKNEDEIYFFQYYDKFVNSYYSLDNMNYSWPYLLLLHTGGNEISALKNFFTIYHKFTNEHNTLSVP
jgi:hypothetical protein